MAGAQLKAQVRTQLGSANARRDRKAGLVPAIVYGHGDESISVAVDALEFNRILSSESGANTLITLDISGKKDTALARQIVRHPTKPVITHVDFIRVNVNEEVEAEVSIHLEGEAEGVKDGGRLEQLHFSITVKAKPADIPTSLTHDISELKIGDQLTAGEIELPAGVSAVTEADTAVAVINVPKVEAEPVATEGEEGAEGEGETATGEASGEAKAEKEGDSGDKE